jgi:hypothetical protein
LCVLFVRRFQQMLTIGWTLPLLKGWDMLISEGD